MADNFRKFSQVIEGIEPNEKAWIRHVLEVQEDVLAVLKKAGVRPKPIEPEWWPGFSWKLRDLEGELWLYSEDNGCLEHVGEFVRAFLDRFRPKACWSVTWADTCSAPRIGEFSGGGLFVSAKRIQFFTPDEQIHRLQKRFEKSARPPHSSV